MADTMAGSSPEPASTPKAKGTPKSKAKPKAAAKTPTKTPTKSKDSVELTPRELELLVGALTNLKDDAKLQVNYEGMAGVTGLKDGKSAKASWASLRKKLNLPGLTPGSGVLAPAVATISPEKPVGVTKTPKKGKAAVKAKKNGKKEEIKDEDDESKEEIAAAADDDASELPDASSAASVAEQDDDKVVDESPEDDAAGDANKNDDSE